MDVNKGRVDINVRNEIYVEDIKYINRNGGLLIQDKEMENHHHIIVEISEENGLLVLTKFSMNTML